MTKEKLNLGKSFNEMIGNKTSTHIAGFWFHITWKGDEGIDQHGNEWTRGKEDKIPHINNKLVQALCITHKEVIELMGKKMNENNRTTPEPYLVNNDII